MTDFENQKETVPEKEAKVAEYAVAVVYSPGVHHVIPLNVYGVTANGIAVELRNTVYNFYERCDYKKPSVMDTLEKCGVFTCTPDLTGDVRLTVNHAGNGYGPGATVWNGMEGYRIHAFVLADGKEKHYMNICVKRLTAGGIMPGIRG